AVLERNDPGVAADEWTHRLDRAVHVPQLHREPDHVSRTDIAGSFRHVDAGEMNVAQRAFDSQPVAAHRGQMRTASDEMNVRSCLLEPCSEIAADAARTNDCHS